MTANDLSEPRQTVAELQGLNTLLDTILETAPIGICFVDRDLRFVRINERLAEINGIPAEAHLGRPVSEVVPTLAETLQEVTGRILTTGEAVLNHEFSGETAAAPGVTRFWCEHWYPVRDRTGEIIGFGGIVEDITERKLAEEALQASENRVHQVIDSMFTFVGMIAPDGTLTEANHASLAAAGLSRSDVIGNPFWDCYWWNYDPAVQKRLRAGFDRAVRGELVRYEETVRLANDERAVLDFVLKPVFDGDRLLFVIPSAENITWRKQVEAERQLRAADRALEGERLAQLFEQAPSFMAMLEGPDHVFQRANDAYLKLVGRRDIVGHPVRDVFPDVDGQGFFELLDQVYASGEAFVGRNFPITFQNAGSDVAEQRFLDFVYQPIVGSDGQTSGIFVDGHDVTEHRRNEAHRELLMRELGHRSKNQLAVVQGVASQTARTAGSLDEFRKLFSTRLQGMAISTDLLVAKQWDGAPLGDLVRRQLEQFGIDGGRLVCEGPDVLLSSDATESIGLALHELATNCVKYGAWSVAGGGVRVSWTLERGGAQPPQLKISWTERGGPPVVPPAREGFGRRVIERMVAQKLGGTVDLVFDVQGVSWTLRAPLTQFTEAPPAGEGTPNQPFDGLN